MKSFNEFRDHLNESSDAHKVMVTVSDPQHTMASQRKEQIMKHVIVRAGDKGEAQAKAEAFYKKKGYKVHGSEYHSKQPATSMKTEEVQLEETESAGGLADKAYSISSKGSSAAAVTAHREAAKAYRKAGDGATAQRHDNIAAVHLKHMAMREDVEQIDELNEAKTPAQKRDFKNMLAGAMSRDAYNKKHGLGKYAAKSGKSRVDPTGVYHNAMKTVGEEVELEEAEIDEAQYGVNLGSRPVSGQKEYQGKEIKSFHPNKEKEAREFAKKHGYVVKKKMLPAGNSTTHTWDIHKEEVELEEAIKLGSKVKVHAPGKDYHDQVGRVGEIRHGAYKGAPKTYTVDYGDSKSVQLDKKNVKLHKEETKMSQMDLYLSAISGNADFASTLDEKKLTAAELKKREEIAQAMERENPGMDMGKKMAIATAQAKKVAEEEQIDEISKETLKSYIPKAMGSKEGSDFMRGVKMGMGTDRKGEDELRAKSAKRSAGIHRAIGKLTKEERSVEDRLAVAKQMYDDKLKSAKSPAERAEAKETYDNIVKRLKEEVELDELSKTTLSKYIKKAAFRVGIHGMNAGEAKVGSKENKVANDKMGKRYLGILKAADKLAKEEAELNLEDFSLEELQDFMVSEDFEQLDELSKKTLGKYLSNNSIDLAWGHGRTVLARRDLETSDDPNVKKDALERLKKNSHLVKNRAKGRDRAISRLTKESIELNLEDYSLEELENFMVSEDFEQLDELSKETLGKYIKKSSQYRGYHGMDAGNAGYRSKDQKDAIDKMGRRQRGVEKAVKRLTKESIELNLEDYSLEELENFMVSEDFEQLDELSKETLGKYIKKSSQYRGYHGMDAGNAGYRSKDQKDAIDKMGRRQRGVEKAVKRLTKESTEDMKTYAQFVAELAEARKTDDDWGTSDIKPLSNVRKVAGTRYGGSAQTDEPEDNDDESKPAEKRGRGRPAGTKSGARH